MMLMGRCLVLLLIAFTLGAWGQSSPASSSAPENPHPQASNPPAAQSSRPRTPDLSPPHADRVNADALPAGESSSKDDQIDLSPPPEDVKAHPSERILDRVDNKSGENAGNNDVTEFHPWDPHKAAKDIEVGDFYFKQKNYRAAESRYREALVYKDNDAAATYRLAECLEKLGRPDDALQEYESYLRILPYGPESEHAKKAIERIKAGAAKTTAGKQQ
jgi:tetratricopeptide (TPR) repeat protein